MGKMLEENFDKLCQGKPFLSKIVDQVIESTRRNLSPVKKPMPPPMQPRGQVTPPQLNIKRKTQKNKVLLDKSGKRQSPPVQMVANLLNQIPQNQQSHIGPHYQNLQTQNSQTQNIQ